MNEGMQGLVSSRNARGNAVSRQRTTGNCQEAVNGRLERPRNSGLGFRNLTNYVARKLLESGGFEP